MMAMVVRDNDGNNKGVGVTGDSTTSTEELDLAPEETTAPGYRPSRVVRDISVDLAMIEGAEGDIRNRLTEDFIRNYEDLLGATARRQIRAYNLTYRDHFDEVYSLVLEAAWTILRELGQPGVQEVLNFPVYLAMRARTMVRIMTESGTHTGISGATAHVRRVRALARRRAMLRVELGREPSKEEVEQLIVRINDELLTTRANAARQGALVSTDDLKHIQKIPIEGFDSPAVITLDEMEIAPFEMFAVIRTVLVRCDGISERLGEIARALYHDYIQDGAGERLTVPEIVEMTGQNRETVRRGVKQIWDISRQVLEDDYGISRNSPMVEED